eukprot:jgi/Botrbrau1/8711/Bobra.0311s0023.2
MDFQDTPDAKRPRVAGKDDGDTPMESPKTEEAAPLQKKDKQPLQQLMRTYYQKVFPHKAFFHWLAYGHDRKGPHIDSTYFHRREFCFTLDGDIFVRYQSFQDGEGLRRAMVDKAPSKIDIGPVYNVDPQRRNAYSGKFAPVERELVFDIDLTDYDDVRSCGKEGHICTKCWSLMALAIQVLDTALREDFGFQHILWVFSGRRGVHAWVCDERARKLTDEQRASVASYLSIYKGNQEGAAKLGLAFASPVEHPSVERAYELLRSAWEETILVQQNLLESQASWEAVLEYVPDEEVRDALRKRWVRGHPLGDDINLTRWRELEAEVQKASVLKAGERNNLGAKSHKQALARCIKEIVFAHAYPRLDVEVSKKMNHLLKAPFCVHPKTAKVCVPVDPSAAFDFNPDTVPTVWQLLEEVAQLGPPGDPAGPGREPPSLADSMRLFQEGFLQDLQAANRQELTAVARETAQEATLAW